MDRYFIALKTNIELIKKNKYNTWILRDIMNREFLTQLRVNKEKNIDYSRMQIEDLELRNKDGIYYIKITFLTQILRKNMIGYRFDYITDQA